MLQQLVSWDLSFFDTEVFGVNLVSRDSIWPAQNQGGGVRPLALGGVDNPPDINVAKNVLWW